MLESTLQARGGRRYRLVRARFDGATSSYSSCRVHRRTILTVRRDDGAEEDVRVFGSSIEQDGRWKVFSCVVD